MFPSDKYTVNVWQQNSRETQKMPTALMSHIIVKISP